MASPRTVRCPQCGAEVAWSAESKWRPFCSQRCKIADLGAWASETYRIPVAQPSESSDLPPDEPDEARDDGSRR